MTRIFVTCMLLLLLCMAVSIGHSSSSSGRSEQQWESEFLSIPSTSGAYEHLSFYTSLPHSAGSAGDYDTAIYTRDMLRSYGLDAEIQTVDALLSFPLQRSLEIISPPTMRYAHCAIEFAFGVLLALMVLATQIQGITARGFRTSYVEQAWQYTR
jgi:hypothetical protein